MLRAPNPSRPHLAVETHELEGMPRQRIANASSIRSRSAPGSRHDVTRERSNSRLSSTNQSTDAISQNTAIYAGSTKKAAEGHTINDPNLEIHSIRTDSSHSSSSDGNQNTNGHKWNENDLPLPTAKLTVLDVAALILNKQIGTGIFTTPGAVLLWTQSKSLSVALWTIGGFWTLMFLLIYLEFGDAFPYNGGELVYLDEIYRQPELLATILFSGFFLTLANSYGNSIQFAKHVLVAAFPGLEDTTELDSRLVRYIAVSVITFVCLIHWHSSRAGLFLNKLVAWYKVGLLVVIFIAGMAKSSGDKSKWSDSGHGGSTTDGMAGMVLIFYSYQGWENANYVAGEIHASARKTSRTTLTMGAILGVTTTWILYVLTTVALYRVLGYDELTGPHADIAVALKFAPKVFASTTGLKVCMAISAFGNVLAVTYTASKVKQSIAIQRILPFWRYLQADEHTPKGALVLHWITSVIFVAFAPCSSDGYSFAVGFYTYGHIVFSVFVAIGLVKLRKRMRSSPEPEHSGWNYTFFRPKPLLYTVPIIFALGNVLILIFAGKTHKQGKIPRWWWPVVISIILFISALYWVGMRILMMKTTAISSDSYDQKTVGDLIGLSVRVEYKGNTDISPTIAEDIDETLAAKVDGSRRRVVVETSGWLASIGKSVDNIRKLVGRYLF